MRELVWSFDMLFYSQVEESRLAYSLSAKEATSYEYIWLMFGIGM